MASRNRREGGWAMSYKNIQAICFLISIIGIAIICFAIGWMLGVLFLSLLSLAFAWAARECEKEEGGEK
jgi:hypothetical protein